MIKEIILVGYQNKAITQNVELPAMKFSGDGYGKEKKKGSDCTLRNHRTKRRGNSNVHL